MGRSGRQKFYDAFAGIGGIRLGMERAGFSCSGSCELDRMARETYAANFGAEPTDADIRDVKRLPGRTSILCAGFPCTPFSSFGRRLGFDDPEQGRLFFELVRLLRASKPPALLFENVKGLLSHDGGRTFDRVMSELSKAGYSVSWKVLDASDFGLAQRRERVFIVGFRSGSRSSHFAFPEPRRAQPTIGDVMEDGVGEEYKASEAMVVTYLRKLKSRGPYRGGRFLQALHTPEEISNTLVTDGDRILIVDGKRVRRMTPREWARLQGFPDRFRLPAARSRAYRQLGNSVPVPVVAAIGRRMRKAMEKRA
jgi:DNA (cytosine-5)-methyltransferase 1